MAVAMPSIAAGRFEFFSSLTTPVIEQTTTANYPWAVMARPTTVFGKQDGGGRRTAKRVRAPLPALLITMSDRHPAILYNVSETGAFLHARNAPAENTELFLQVDSLDVYARVVWKCGEECGLEFEKPIRRWDVELLRAQAGKGIEARLTAAEKGGADDWGTGVAR